MANLPTIPEDVTFSWLQQAIGKQFTQAQISAVSIAQQDFAGDMPPEFDIACELFLPHQHSIADWFEEGKPTLIHGDAHIGNLFFGGVDRVSQVRAVFPDIHHEIRGLSIIVVP